MKLGLLFFASLCMASSGFKSHSSWTPTRTLSLFSTAHSDGSKPKPLDNLIKEPLGALTQMYKERERESLAAKPEPAFFKPTSDMERINGRVAMVALVVIIVQELWDGLSITEQIDRFVCSLEHVVGC